jgi:hypothetical protein
MPQKLPQLDVLAALPFARGVPSVERATAGARGDGTLVLATPRGKTRFDLVVRRQHLSYPLVDDLVAAHADALRPWILFAPSVGEPMGRYLAERGVQYVDAAGNCRVVLGDRYLAWVSGRRATRRPPAQTALRAAGYQVMFAILARPALLDEPVRTVAAAAGVGKSAVSDTLRRLRDDGTLQRTRGGLRLVERDRLLSRWLAGYHDVVRPRAVIGRYRTADADPLALESKLAKALKGETWALGGAAGVHRFDPTYRGPETIVHVATPPDDLARRLKALPAADGPLTLLRTPGALAFEGPAEGVAHSLLLYAELLLGDVRSRTLAATLRGRLLGVGT